MQKRNRIISTIITICFIFNTVVSDLAFGLAAPSKLDDLVDIEHKDAGRIELALEMQLKSLAGKDKTLPRTVDEFLRALNAWEAREETIVGPANMAFDDMQIFSREITALEEGLFFVKCRIADEKSDKKPRTYYAMFSPVRDKDGGFHIEVYTEKEWIDNGVKEFIAKNIAVPVRGLQKPKDAEAIDKYVEAEKIIDRFWAKKMQDKDAHVVCSDNIIRALLFDEFIDVREEFERLGITEENSRLLLILNALIWVGHKDLIFVHANDDELPEIHIKDRSGNLQAVKVRAHSSNQNIFIALSDSEWTEFQKIKDKLEAVGEEMVHHRREEEEVIKNYQQDIKAAIALKNRTDETLFHEIGAFCGLNEWAEERDGKVRAYNELDKLRDLTAQPETPETRAEIARLQ